MTSKYRTPRITAAYCTRLSFRRRIERTQHLRSWGDAHGKRPLVETSSCLRSTIDLAGEIVVLAPITLLS